MAILNNSNAISTAGGYDINNSLRFRRSNNAYLSRTPASAGNQKTWTYSAWVKRGLLGSIQDIWHANGPSTTENDYFAFDSDTLQFRIKNSNVVVCELITTQVFRDPSAWYHIIVAWDSTQATSSNRVKIYVNGVQVTSFSTATYPSQNTNTNSYNSNVLHTIGTQWYNSTLSNYYDGYITEINFIDGQALTASSFGETDTTTGVWKPKAYSGTYGTNGFYLKFSDIATTSGSNAGLGKDFSGNSNYWTTNNISVTSGTTYDAMKDSPTNTSATVANYAVWSPLVGSVGVTLSQANLSATFDTASGTRYGTIGTIGVSSGKWYWEYEFSAGGNSALLGITQKPFAVQMGTWPGEQTGDYGYYGSNGNKYTAGSGSAYGATFTTGDIIGVALDLDAGTLTFYKNNSSQGTAFSSISGTFFPAIGKGITATGITSFVNFGQRPFTYTPPTGYVALNTYNLPDSTIKKGNSYMDATLYTGNGYPTSGTQSITNAASFKPDLVWIKIRSGAGSHTLTDSVRGVNSQLFSNQTAAQETNTDHVTAFNSNGFSLGTGSSGTYPSTNSNGSTYVGWQWQAGQGSTSSNTSGSITSTVSVNTTAGFSIGTFTSPASGTCSVGHGLGVKPAMTIVKCRSVGNSGWFVWHQALGDNNTDYLSLQSTAAEASFSTMWGTVGRTSTLLGFTQGGSLEANATHVFYAWAEIAGFSKFGSYTGNGSTDGPFVFTNFLPRWVLIKQSSSAGNSWQLIDTARETTNPDDTVLFPNSTNAEGTGNATLDFLSNGFKVRTTDGTVNTSSSTYIYAAFAENPFKNANAR